MPVNHYFAEIWAAISSYSSAGLIVSSDISFDIRSEDIGYIKGTLAFVNNSNLHFREYIWFKKGRMEKVSYAYHYQDEAGKLIFRYDNALHRSALGVKPHKHTLSGVTPAFHQ